MLPVVGIALQSCRPGSLMDYVIRCSFPRSTLKTLTLAHILRILWGLGSQFTGSVSPTGMTSTLEWNPQWFLSIVGYLAGFDQAFPCSTCFR
ncbi:MAG TPA: hypothetical protein VLM91_11970 [Candidatus Methylomirabilis sp.]|nr:hypothetical protein [Candidatus Methylomirabilis sp.]